eukprot:TRINITY_DN3976_c0_g3_i1.p2 TRINITY_DN3976_c0_g3~~TRINITY_DN3976_c0_g3_i1.p2  ORF type:complete len:189 (+),score=29.25 TRINITY_DN3976_c0_g3_i1:104-670(+)
MAYPKINCVCLFLATACVLLFGLLLVLYQLPVDSFEAFTACKMPQPPLFSVNGTSLMLNGTYFLIQGIGYSPTPPGYEATDYYMNSFSFLFERDIPLIQSTGANTLRLWSWYTAANHAMFFNAVNQSDLYVLLPFMMTVEFYPDLSDPDVQQSVLVDWSAFIKQHKYESRVIAYLIGNGELRLIKSAK